MPKCIVCCRTGHSLSSPSLYRVLSKSFLSCFLTRLSSLERNQKDTASVSTRSSTQNQTKTITQTQISGLGRIFTSVSTNLLCFAISLLSMRATFSQFFLVEQKMRQEWSGMTSVTRPSRWSGSIRVTSALY